MVESSLVVFANNRVIAQSKGLPAQVEFDFDSVWAFKKQNKFIFHADLLLWLHVHPHGYGVIPSATDLNCARGLNIALGGLGKFGIMCFHDEDLGNITGDCAIYELQNDQLVQSGKNLSMGDRFPYYHEAVILKTLSCT
jgi:hypothetical protein